LTLVTILLGSLTRAQALPAELPTEYEDDKDAEDGADSGDGDGDDEGGVGVVLLTLHLLTLLVNEEISSFIAARLCHIFSSSWTCDDILLIILTICPVITQTGGAGGAGGAGGGGSGGGGGAGGSGDRSEGGTEVLQPGRYEVPGVCPGLTESDTPVVNLQVFLHSGTQGV